ncbi:MAG: 16S rRNA (guanine(527)-N(7))-methyltransferase RsmG [Dehalococcoidia bacterium]|nr:16S rRNA (guanine(527)-N(7))-methyltransferase RsmG [Dehalococcoidia bacterium]
MRTAKGSALGLAVPRDARLLTEGAARLGAPLGTREVTLFRRYYELLAEVNQRVNLTSVEGWDAVQCTHFLDSLSVAQALPPQTLADGFAIDVGSGAGFPGVPLHIVYPGFKLVLLEATGKKAAFLKHLVTELGLEGATPVYGRAEELGHDPRYRERFDAAFARAVGSMAVLAELTLPFLKPGGLLVAQKKGDFAGELADAEYALHALGGRLQEVRSIEVPQLAEQRVLVVVQKAVATPERYPRRSGMPAKRPLKAPRHDAATLTGA